MSKLLTLKHWQLFALVFGIPMVLQLILFATFISGSGSSAIFWLLPVLIILSVTLFYGWFYTLGINLHRKLPPSAPMNLTRFKIFLFFPVFYILLFFAFFVWMLAGVYSGADPHPAIFIIIVALHLSSMFCTFYCLYFISKALKTAEWQRPVTFNDFAGDFFLLWFFPVGIWFIQPRVNKLFDTDTVGPGHQ